ncbi:MAG: glycosyltransferase family 4 protein [Candidatus Parcubacteria bacterium]|nr:glycosyltransferase family 4 protein [Burkholderiales bacterium]
MQSVLFYRDYVGFSGGHLKVWDYFNHVRHSPRHKAEIFFSSRSVWDASNPWQGLKGGILGSWDAIRPDCLFLGGTDWLMVNPAERARHRVPVINLVQGVRHAVPGDARYPFLRHRAIRICLADSVAQAIAGTGQVNGPIIVIPNGFDKQDLPAPLPRSGKTTDLLISALKEPELGRQLQRRFAVAGRRVELLEGRISRPDFLGALNRARVTLHLPTRIGGFCLPALEGMALGTIVVCPDCVGNRSLCIPGLNCFLPEYDLESIAGAAETALRLDAAEAEQLLSGALATVARYGAEAERRAFLELLDRADELWQSDAG